MNNLGANEIKKCVNVNHPKNALGNGFSTVKRLSSSEEMIVNIIGYAYEKWIIKHK